MDAKNRSIGIDKSYLDKQVEEKRQRELAEKESKLADGENLRQLMVSLDDNEASAQEARQRSLLQVKQTLDTQRMQPKNNALCMNGPVDLSRCGPASLQCLSGEDRVHEMRKRAQQEQVKLWCAQDMIDKQRAHEEERRAEEKYAAHVLEQDRLRLQLEEEARRKRDEEARLRQRENLEYTRQANLQKQAENDAVKRAQSLQSHYLQTCPLMAEDTQLAHNVNAEHRFRPDHFKGYEKDTRNQFWRENDLVVKEKQHNLRQEQQAEADWARYQSDMLHKMKQAEDAKQRMIAEENRIQREILAQQKAELEQRKAELERRRLQEIGQGFFSKFGQSS